MNWVQIYNVVMPNGIKQQFKVEAMKCYNNDCQHQWHVHLETYITNVHYGATIHSCTTLEEACEFIDGIQFDSIANIAMQVYDLYYKEADYAIRKASGN